MTSSLAGLEAAADIGCPAIVRAVAWRVRLRLKAPVLTAGRVLRGRDVAVVMLRDAEGCAGWGEAGPLAGFARPRRVSLSAALAEFLSLAIGRTPAALAVAVRRQPPRDAVTAAVAFAVESAALDLLARRAGLTLRSLLSRDAASSVPVNALLVGKTPGEVAESARGARREGFSAAKLKVGGRPLPDDIARVRAARDGLGRGSVLRLDANGAWSEEEAAQALEAFAPFEIEYVEQPLPPGDPPALARLRRRSPIPIAADEDVVSLEAVEALLRAGATDVVIVKPAVVGGLTAALAAAEAAAAHGVVPVVTSALDGGLAVAAAAQLAASLPGHSVAHGLATVRLLVRDTAEPSLAVADGRLDLPDTPGIGTSPAPWVLARRPLLEVRG